MVLHAFFSVLEHISGCFMLCFYAACFFLAMNRNELFSGYLGETEKIVRQLFSRARQLAPCVLFFDELDVLAPRRGCAFFSLSFSLNLPLVM